MLKCKIFTNPREVDVNRFFEKTKGKFVAMSQSESVQNIKSDEDQISHHHYTLTILYEVESSGGMQAK